jgi:hypothetical protein
MPRKEFATAKHGSKQAFAHRDGIEGGAVQDMLQKYIISSKARHNNMPGTAMRGYKHWDRTQGAVKSPVTTLLDAVLRHNSFGSVF